jgi:Uma2 family endonuclease
MVRTLPDDGKRYESVDGELLVTPAPVRRHQRMVGQLFRLLADYVERGGLGEALCSPADIEAGERTLVQPDLFVVPLTAGRLADDWVEVRELLGVPECWIVDLDAQSQSTDPERCTSAAE